MNRTRINYDYCVTPGLRPTQRAGKVQAINDMPTHTYMLNDSRSLHVIIMVVQVICFIPVLFVLNSLFSRSTTTAITTVVALIVLVMEPRSGSECSVSSRQQQSVLMNYVFLARFSDCVIFMVPYKGISRLLCPRTASNPPPQETDSTTASYFNDVWRTERPLIKVTSRGIFMACDICT